MAFSRFVVVGAVNAGKTSLLGALYGRKEKVCKTQAVEWGKRGGIDTPGEFLSHPRFFHALIVTATEADILLYVHAANDREYRFPPGLLNIYENKPVIGVVTKIDAPDADVEYVEQLLRRHGLDGPIFQVNTADPISLDPLRIFLGRLSIDLLTAESDDVTYKNR